MPELVVSLDAATTGRPDIAIGNVVGSNIGNVLLILGSCALITPLVVKPLALRRDAVVVVAASVLFLILVGGSGLNRVDSGIFLLALLAYLAWAYRTETSSPGPSAELHIAEGEELAQLPESMFRTAAWIGVGLLLLVGGSHVFLTGAVGIAGYLGVPEAVVGLTLVAVGTALPDFSISVIAAVRGHSDVAVGNVLGSNIFNLLGVRGVSALLQPLPVHGRVLDFDQWVMLGTALLLWLFLYTGRRLGLGGNHRTRLGPEFFNRLLVLEALAAPADITVRDFRRQSVGIVRPEG